MNATLATLLARNWRILLWRGIAGILFGILALLWPGLTLLTLLFVYGAYALIDGVFALIAACTGGALLPRWWLLLVGVIGIGAGVVIFTYPGASLLVLTMFVGFWAIAHGIFEVIGAIQLRKEIDNEWWLILSGILSVAFGVLLVWNPGVSAVAMIWILGVYALIFGIAATIFALRLRKQKNFIVS